MRHLFAVGVAIATLPLITPSTLVNAQPQQEWATEANQSSVSEDDVWDAFATGFMETCTQKQPAVPEAYCQCLINDMQTEFTLQELLLTDRLEAEEIADVKDRFEQLASTCALQVNRSH